MILQQCAMFGEHAWIDAGEGVLGSDDEEMEAVVVDTVVEVVDTVVDSLVEEKIAEVSRGTVLVDGLDANGVDDTLTKPALLLFAIH